MFGANPILGLLSGDGKVLQVHDIFSTIQGEGEFTGCPSIFIRLSGCNLACKFCDTEFDSFQEMAIEDIILKIKELSHETNVKLVTITGGEPLRQPIGKLCEMLIKHDFSPQVETNGTLSRELPESVKIVCSPKPAKNGYSRIRQDLLAQISSFKFIISKHYEHYDSVPEIGQSVHNTPVFVQPMDEYDDAKNTLNIQHAIALAKKHNYRLSIQIHKVLGIK